MHLILDCQKRLLSFPMKEDAVPSASNRQSHLYFYVWHANIETNVDTKAIIVTPPQAKELYGLVDL